MSSEADWQPIYGHAHTYATVGKEQLRAVGGVIRNRSTVTSLRLPTPLNLCYEVNERSITGILFSPKMNAGLLDAFCPGINNVSICTDASSLPIRNSLDLWRESGTGELMVDPERLEDLADHLLVMLAHNSGDHRIFVQSKACLHRCAYMFSQAIEGSCSAAHARIFSGPNV